MRSLEELREFFSHDRYATATTGIEILEAEDGYAKVGLAVHEGHMNAGNRVMGAVYYTMADFAFAVASNPARSGRAERQAFMKQRSGMNWIL